MLYLRESVMLFSAKTKSGKFQIRNGNRHCYFYVTLVAWSCAYLVSRVYQSLSCKNRISIPRFLFYVWLLGSWRAHKNFSTMKRFLFLGMAALVAAAAFSLTSCGGDDDKTDPNGNGGGSVPDPEGTILIQMRNRDNGHTEIFPEGCIGWFYMDTANNFSCNPMFGIVSVGKIKGLGNILHIPEKGWSDEIAVVPGCGYIYKDGVGGYCRIYVVDYIKSTGGGIIGATIKYQSPFIPENLPAGDPEE